MIDISATMPVPTSGLSRVRRRSSTKPITNIRQKIVRKIAKMVLKKRLAK